MIRSKPLAVCLAFSFVLVGSVFVGSTPATAESRWGIAELIEFDDTGGATDPNVAVDGSGRVFVVWSQFDGTRNNIWSSRFLAGFGWEARTPVETSTQDAGAPDVAADSNGNAIAVWQQHDGTRYNIWANRFVPATGWGSASLIESDDAGNAYVPRVAMDGSGNAVAAWQHHDGARWRAVANRYSVTTGWETPVAVDPGTGAGVVGHALAVAANGDAVVVVSQCCGPANVWANVYSGGTWSGPGLIETDNAGDAINPSVAMEGNGNAMAAWRQSDGTYRNAVANRFVAGVGWGTAGAIESNPGDVGSTPQVAVDGAGNATVVWEQWDGTRNNIWTNRFDGATWGAPVLLESDPEMAYFPDIAVHPSGDALAVWAQSAGGPNDIWASRFRPATGWRAAERIERSAGNAVSPSVVIDADRNGMAAWSQSDGTRQNVWANRFVADTVAPPLDVRSPIDGTLTNIPTVTVAGTTEPGAVVMINGSAVVVLGDGSFSQTYAGLADGAHTWTIVATDDEGNARTETRSVTVDTTPPTLAFSSPTDGSVLNTPTFLVSGTTEAGARLVVRGLVVDVDPFGTFSFYLTLPEGGPHNVFSTAADPAGNARTVVWSIRIDTTPPFLALFSPAPGLTNNPSVTVSGVSEPDATVFINGTAAPTDPGGFFSLTATMPDGQHIFDVNAFDAVMNVAFRSVEILVDTAAPVLSITAPSDGAVTSSPVVTVSGTTEPDVRLVVNGLVVAVDPGGSFAFAIALLDGANTITATATDPAGNVAAASVTITYTNPVPGLQQQLQALQDQLAAMNQRLQDLEDDLAATNRTLLDVQADLDTATTALDALQGQLDTTNQALRDTEDALAAANARLDALQANLFLGLVAVVVILGVLQVALARMGRRKGGANRRTEEREEEPET